ncbi:MAG TPA: magnesium transporter CorA family protein [Candidatus Kapabacteria bacterium]|nr:magnesium transporter CorA family protein [Candidatus Kapabacteria bacterium]
MAIKTLKEQNLTWINIDTVNDEALAFLKGNYSFHPLDLEDIQSEQQTPKIDAYKNYLFVVMQFPQWQAATNTVVAHEVDIFIGENYLITIQREKSKELKSLFYRCMNNRKVRSDWMSGSSGYLLYHIIEELLHNAHPILNHIGKHISSLENEIFAAEPNSIVIRELAIERRNVLSFRRILDPERYVISSLKNTPKPFLPQQADEGLTIYFDNIQDYLSNMWAVVESYKETINGLHITVESLINRRTNKIISTLTMISVSFMPLTLLSGLYGMNIDHLPFAHEPHYVWLMYLGLFAVIVLTIFIMRRKRDI